MTEIAIRSRKNFDQKYKHLYMLKSHMNDMLRKLGTTVVELSVEDRAGLPPNIRVHSPKFAWYVVDKEDSDRAAAIYSNVLREKLATWWFWSETTDPDFMKELASDLLVQEMIDLETGKGVELPSKEEKSGHVAISPQSVVDKIIAEAEEEDGDEDGDDDDEETYYEVEVDEIVVVNGVGPVLVLEDTEKGWKGVRTNGSYVLFHGTDVDVSETEDLVTDNVREQIVEDFGLNDTYLDGEGGDYNIRRLNGRLVAVQDVDPETFSIQIDGEWIRLGAEADKLMPSKLNKEDVYQMYEDVTVDVNGREARGTVRAVNEDGDGYQIEFEDWVDVHEDNVSD